MDAITLLRADHGQIKSLLAQLESTTEQGVKTRTELFTRIKDELTVHQVIEEEIFYPRGPGDEVAFSQLVAAYHADMARVAFVACGDRELAEDAVQSAWLVGPGASCMRCATRTACARGCSRVPSSRASPRRHRPRRGQRSVR